MPSTHKTEYLNLNNWIGEDKPKRDDWNTDNQKVDTAFNTINQTLISHSSDNGIHVTSAEKSLWSAGQSALFYSYTGNSAASRSFTLPKKPVFAIIFAVNKPPFAVLPVMSAYSGFLSSSGCSAGLALTSNGFSVTHQSNADPNNFKLSYNESGTEYICVYWS